MGDIQAHDTIKVQPGDNLTFDWHHEIRNDTDDVIANSHHGPSLIYISPDPPTENSFVKLWHSGKYESNPFPQAGKWSTTSDIAKHFGHMNVRVPEGLKAGHYIIRAEMVGLHEGDVSYVQNPKRGAQFYPDCVQILVEGDGEVELPEGVSFPGAYSYEDPGVVHNVRPPSIQALTLSLFANRYRYTALLRRRSQKPPPHPALPTTSSLDLLYGLVLGLRPLQFLSDP